MSPPPPEPLDPPDPDESGEPEQAAAPPSEASFRRALDLLRHGHRLLHLGIFARRALRSEPVSARLVEKALRLLLRAIVELETPEAADAPSTAALVDQVTALNHDGRWFRHPLAEDFGLLQKLAEGFDQDDFEPYATDRRRYRRLLRRLPAVFQQTRARLIHERGRLPAVRARRRRRLVVGSLATLAVVAGLVGYQALRTRDCVTGQYFAGPDHDELVYQRRDCVIDFDWEMGPPGGDVPADDFSVRWEGELEIEADGLYTFELSSDDGSRLFIDGRLVIDHWSDHGFSPLQGSIRLSEGRQPFRVEYYDRDGLAAVRLSWRKDDGPSEVVPAAAMVAP